MKKFLKNRGVKSLKDFVKWIGGCIVALAYIPYLIYWVFMVNWGANWIEKIFGKKIEMRK